MDKIDDTLKNAIQGSWMVTNTRFDFDFVTVFNTMKNETMDQAGIVTEIDINRVKTLQERFRNAVNTIVYSWSGAKNINTTEVTSEWFEKLLVLHSHEDRAYHTFCHIEEMIGYIDLFFTPNTRDITDDISQENIYYAIVIICVFFHDAIYDAKSATNEEDSLSLYQSFEKQLLECIIHSENQRTRNTDTKIHFDLSSQWQHTNKVSVFILATKSHNLDSIKERDDQMFLEYLKIFLDADMAVLGKCHDAYDHYASLIRKEYIHVPHTVYCEKRAEVLQSFVEVVQNVQNRDVHDNMINKSTSRFIFSSGSMRQALEEQAVDNLRREIQCLQSGSIPRVTTNA